jgi:hypothetical protein
MDRSEGLLTEIEAFLVETGIAARDFGREAMGDPPFVADLRKGRHPGPETKERARAGMRRFREKFQQEAAAE